MLLCSQTSDATNPSLMKAFSGTGFLSVLNLTLTQRCKCCFCFQMEWEACTALHRQMTRWDGVIAFYEVKGHSALCRRQSRKRNHLACRLAGVSSVFPTQLHQDSSHRHITSYLQLFVRRTKSHASVLPASSAATKHRKAWSKIFPSSQVTRQGICPVHWAIQQRKIAGRRTSLLN